MLEKAGQLSFQAKEAEALITALRAEERDVAARVRHLYASASVNERARCARRYTSEEKRGASQLICAPPRQVFVGYTGGFPRPLLCAALAGLPGWFARSSHALHTALPGAYFDELGVPRLTPY